MDVNIIGRNVGITDRFREYANEKAEKVAHLADRALALEIRVCRHHTGSQMASSGDDRVELTLIGPGPLVRAESAASDKYAAFDLAIGKLMERIRRVKDRKKVHRGQHRPPSLHEVATGGFSAVALEPADVGALNGANAASEPSADDLAEANEDYSPVVIREKVFPAVPMTVDDALYRMELVGHDFYLFVDSGTMQPSVVYRRKGWNYGVIHLDENADATPLPASEGIKRVAAATR